MAVVTGRNERKIGDFVYYAIIYTVLGILTLLCVFPFYYLIINSISANDASANGNVLFYPIKVHFKNYTEVLKITGLSQSAVVSVSRTLFGTLGTLLGSTLLGFMFTQNRMWKRRLWYRFTIAPMYFNAGLIPWYITMMNLGLLNNFLAYILPAIVQPFYIILIKTYIEGIPESLQESAEIDGAHILRVYAQIIIPLAQPIIATVAIFAAVNQWNAFQDTLLLMTDQKLHPLQFTLYRYISQASSLASLMKSSSGLAQVTDLATTQTPVSVRMTVSVVVVAPILLIYPFFQRYFIKGIMIGAVKG